MPRDDETKSKIKQTLSGISHPRTICTECGKEVSCRKAKAGHNEKCNYHRSKIDSLLKAAECIYEANQNKRRKVLEDEIIKIKQIMDYQYRHHSRSSRE